MPAYMRYRGHKTLGVGTPAGNKGALGVVVYATPEPGRGWLQCDPAELIDAPPEFNGRNPKTDDQGVLLPPKFMRPIFWMINPDQMRIVPGVIDDGPALIVQIYRNPQLEEMRQMGQAHRIVMMIGFACGYARFCISLKSPTKDPLPKILPHDVKDLPPSLSVAEEKQLEEILKEQMQQSQQPGIVVASEKDVAMMTKAVAKAADLKIVR